MLNAVGGTSDHDVWVVGGGLIEHWNGSTWALSLQTSRKLFFHGVSAFSPTNAFVVGYDDSNPESFRAVTERWNGTSWKSVTVPEPGVDRGLSAVVAVAQNWYAAVGWEDPSDTVDLADDRSLDGECMDGLDGTDDEAVVAHGSNGPPVREPLGCWTNL